MLWGKNLKGKEIGKESDKEKMGGMEPESQLRGSGNRLFYLWNKSSASEKAKKHVFSGGSPRCSRLWFEYVRFKMVWENGWNFIRFES